MIDEIAEDVTRTTTTPRMLDPFGFCAEAASRIAGLGGTGTPPVADYAFHTDYRPLARGAARFTVRFAGLTATTGRLVVQVNLIPPGGNAHARVASIVRVPLATLAGDGGMVEIACEGFAGARYALFGTVAEDTDATADALSITLAQDGDPFVETLEETRTHRFAIRADDPLAPLFDPAPATLAQPVSQMCTAAQFHERAYDKWLARLGVPRSHHRKQWEFIYVLQVLKTQGMLRAGKRGLGFGIGREPLPAFMASRGVDVLATDLPGDHDDVALWNPSGQYASTVAALSNPGLCDDATLMRHVSFRGVDMTRIPDDLTGFDFCWSSCAYEHLGSIAAGLAFVARSVDCLKPGGIAVHTTELNLSSNDDTIDQQATVLFRRRDMERLALELIAAGHDVAPIRLDLGDTPLDDHVDVPPYLDDPHLKMAIGQYATTSFGIVVRRGGQGA